MRRRLAADLLYLACIAAGGFCGWHFRADVGWSLLLWGLGIVAGWWLGGLWWRLYRS